MKRIFIPAVVALMAITVLPSCKKDSDPTRAEMLVGNWKTSEEGTDANGNGTWEASERTAVPAAEVATITFASDGTGTTAGTISGVPISVPFKWNLQNSDNDLRIISTFLGTTDTATQSIVSLSSSELVGKDASSNPVEYMSLKKQ